MSFREYLIENEQAAKLVELGKRKRAELQNLQNARQRGDIDTAKYWNSAQMNTQKEIEKIKAAINNVISTTNYNQLAQYKQSAENASEYLKAAAAMQA
jgi:hypothetical protein